MNTLGERIRKVRKQQKLTLEALAGNELTKGMLSLIENNKANPSMESLTYIAERLGVDVSELLEEVSTTELQTLLEKVETLYHVEYEETTDEYEQIIELVEPVASKLTHGYESARLLELVGCSMYHLKNEEWQERLTRAATIYEAMNIVSKRANIGIFRSKALFMQHNYTDALQVLLYERSEIEKKNAYIDPLIRLDFDYWEAALYYAVGDSQAAARVVDSAIAYSKEKRVFSNIDGLYRLAAAHAMMTGDEESMAYYVNKLKLYGEFSDDAEFGFFPVILETHYLNSYKQQYEKALSILNLHSEEYEVALYRSPYFNLEKGKALYGLHRYEEALAFLEGVSMADYIHHPLDLSIFFEKEAYMALAYQALGHTVEAQQFAQLAFTNISDMPPTPYKDFIEEAYRLIYGRTI